MEEVILLEKKDFAGFTGEVFARFNGIEVESDKIIFDIEYFFWKDDIKYIKYISKEMEVENDIDEIVTMPNSSAFSLAARVNDEETKGLIRMKDDFNEEIAELVKEEFEKVILVN